MARRTLVFVRQGTGERKAFAEDGYTVDTTTMYPEQGESARVSFFRAQDGYRIDRKPDGTFRDKYDIVWLPESTQP